MEIMAIMETVMETIMDTVQVHICLPFIYNTCMT